MDADGLAWLALWLKDVAASQCVPEPARAHASGNAIAGPTGVQQYDSSTMHGSRSRLRHSLPDTERSDARDCPLPCAPLDICQEREQPLRLINKETTALVAQTAVQLVALQLTLGRRVPTER